MQNENTLASKATKTENGVCLCSLCGIPHKSTQKVSRGTLSLSSHAYMYVTHIINVTHMNLVCKGPKYHAKVSPCSEQGHTYSGLTVGLCRKPKHFNSM